MNVIQRQAKALDQDAVFDMLYEEVEIKKTEDSYMEALAKFIEENDLGEAEIRSIVGPALRQLILKEASVLNLVEDEIKVTRDIGTFFG